MYQVRSVSDVVSVGASSAQFHQVEPNALTQSGNHIDVVHAVTTVSSQYEPELIVTFFMLESVKFHETSFRASCMVVAHTVLVVALSVATLADRSSEAQSSNTSSVVQAGKLAVHADHDSATDVSQV